MNFSLQTSFLLLPCFRLLVFCLLLISGISVAIPSKDEGKSKPTIVASKSQEKIILDGELKESVWTKAQSTGPFICNFPYDTLCAKTNTEVRVCYDSEMLYVGAICFDTLKGDYVIQSLKRDFSYPVSDAFSIVLDPFLDGVNGFSFGVNPYGVQREGLIAGGGGMGVSTDWDNTWYSAVKRFDGYWTAEIGIPFKTIRFKDGLCEWGINFTRNDLKRNESSTWSKVPRAYNIASLAFTGKLLWDEAPEKRGKNISIIPYTLSQSSINYQDASPKIITKINAGIDAKVAVSSALNLDITANPDFSQVEVDRQVTNLTRFSIFFPERRNFFLENSDLFSNFGFRQIRPFFSRQIGLKNGSLIPILGGLRLSGKLNPVWRIGAMNLLTQEVNSETTKLPRENYSVVAFQRKMFVRSALGGLFVYKQSFDTAKSLGLQYNGIAGLDFNLASADNRWNGKAFFHYNLEPEKKNLSYAHATWLNYTVPKFSLEWNHEYVGKNYNPQTGFVPRNKQFDARTNKLVSLSYWRLENSGSRSFFPKSNQINNHGPFFFTDSYYTDSLTITDGLIQVGYQIGFQNSSAIRIKGDQYYTRFLFDVLIPGIKDTLKSGEYRYKDVALNWASNKRRKLTAVINASAGGYLNGTKVSTSAELSGRIQPFAILSMNASFDRITFAGTGNTSTLALLGPRLEFTFSKSVFLTTFIQLNTQTNQLNVNARFQWRFKPMSDLFIVYTDNSTTQNGLGAWLPQRQNRALVFKFVYWFNA